MGMTQRERCEQALAELARIDRTMEQGTLNGAHIKRWQAKLDYLADFVMVEAGRHTDTRLDESAPLVLYIPTKEARDEIVKAIEAEMPNARWREMP